MARRIFGDGKHFQRENFFPPRIILTVPGTVLAYCCTADFSFIS
jgi:hypothetical protein